MTCANDNHPSQRFTPYRAVIPFYILYDLDLNANHLRLYGQIEQMESNPDPSVQPAFSTAWLANQLGINERNTRKMAAFLVKKNYLVHEEVSPGKWIWKTVKKPVSHTEKKVADGEEGGLPETGGGVSQRQGGGVSERQVKIPEVKIPEDKDITPIVPKGTQSAFPDFWQMYPIKKGRKKCEEKWRRLKLDERAPIIIAKLKAQIEKDDQWHRGFVPHPLTYLNGSLWEDELATKPRNGKPKKQYY